MNHVEVRARRSDKELAWHYTTGSHFLAIVESGRILPATAYVSGRERPIVWFSTNQQWEQTANKMWRRPDGKLQPTTTRGENYKLGGGLVRFGLPARNLTPWPKLGRKAGISRSMARALEFAAHDAGADPSEWSGCFEPVDVRDCVVEALSDSGQWERVPIRRADDPLTYRPSDMRTLNLTCA